MCLFVLRKSLQPNSVVVESVRPVAGGDVLRHGRMGHRFALRTSDVIVGIVAVFRLAVPT